MQNCIRIPDRQPEDWHDYLERIRADNVVVDLPIIKREPANSGVAPALNQMGASQRGEVLLAHYDGDLAIHADSDTVHHYNGVVWTPCRIKSCSAKWHRFTLMLKLPIHRTPSNRQ